MNRIVTGTLLMLAIASTAAVASAATTIPLVQSASIAKASSAPVDYRAQCQTLGKQWASASLTNGTNKNFAAAKADAAKGEKLCKSARVSLHRKGAVQYEAALKLIGVVPTS